VSTAPASWRRRGLALFSDLLVASGAIWFVGVVLWIARQRWDYPYDLEWMEPGSLGHVLRVLDGEPIYARPSVEFTPFIYNPLYYWVCAGACSVFGTGLPAMRLVSIVCFCVSLVLLAWLAWRETKSVIASVFIAPGVFAATFEKGGAWFDVARADSMMVMLLLGAALALRVSRGRTNYLALGGLLLVLAFFTKQLAALPIAALVSWVVLRNPKRGVFWAAIVAGTVIALVVLLEASSDGWYSYYAFTLGSSHPWNYHNLYQFWTQRTLTPLPVASAALIPLVARLFESKRAGIDRVFLPTFVIGLLFGSWLGILHTGGWLNVLLPGYAGLALALAATYAQLSKLSTPTGGTLRVFVSALVAAQFFVLRFDVSKNVPTLTSRVEGQLLVEELRSVEGPIYAPDAAIYPWLAGHPMQVHAIAIEDVLRGHRNDVRTEYLAELRTSIDERHWGAGLFGNRIIVGSQEPLFRRGYGARRAVRGPPTYTGMESRAYVLALPNERR
jgi:4-amino-4-deoxy-L-arabinose transferase-like glycosyltransferase